MFLVISNAPPEKAQDLARTLVSESVAACVNVIPGIRSFYHWEGQLCEESEDGLFIKVSAEGLPKLMQRLRELHPYTVPEIVAIAADQVHPPYLRWVRGEP